MAKTSVQAGLMGRAGRHWGGVAAGAALGLCGASAIGQQVLFQNSNDNGFFAPFTSATPAGVRYGDAGWLTPGGSPPYFLYSITLRLAAFGSETPGTANLSFRFHDGDPAGLFFGPGTVLHSATVPVAIPAAPLGQDPTYFDVEIPLPNVRTAGNFNNVGFSIGVQNFSYSGSLGFACATGSAVGQPVGFYTSNASFFNGTAWSLFAFGADPVTGVANFVATITGDLTPRPCTTSDIAGPGPTPGADGELTADDIIQFVGWFTTSDARADIAGPGGEPLSDGEFTADDIILFINRFTTGC
jgi:hypothetical protein